MPMNGIVVYGRINGSRGSNTPGFGYLTPVNGTDLDGSGNGSTPVPRFGNQTADTGTDLDGSGGQGWIQIIIPILFVVFLPLILIGSVRWVSNFIFLHRIRSTYYLKRNVFFDQQKYMKEVLYLTCLKCLDLYWIKNIKYMFFINTYFFSCSGDVEDLLCVTAIYQLYNFNHYDLNQND